MKILHFCWMIVTTSLLFCMKTFFHFCCIPPSSISVDVSITHITRWSPVICLTCCGQALLHALALLVNGDCQEKPQVLSTDASQRLWKLPKLSQSVTLECPMGSWWWYLLLAHTETLCGVPDCWSNDQEPICWYHHKTQCTAPTCHAWCQPNSPESPTGVSWLHFILAPYVNIFHPTLLLTEHARCGFVKNHPLVCSPVLPAEIT